MSIKNFMLRYGSADSLHDAIKDTDDYPHEHICKNPFATPKHRREAQDMEDHIHRVVREVNTANDLSPYINHKFEPVRYNALHGHRLTPKMIRGHLDHPTCTEDDLRGLCFHDSMDSETISHAMKTHPKWAGAVVNSEYFGPEHHDQYFRLPAKTQYKVLHPGNFVAETLSDNTLDWIAKNHESEEFRNAAQKMIHQRTIAK
jgi:hypothetical protein